MLIVSHMHCRRARIGLAALLFVFGCAEASERLPTADGGDGGPTPTADAGIDAPIWRPVDAALDAAAGDAGPITCVAPAPFPPVCDPAVCGNGVIDSCSRCRACGGGGLRSSDAGSGECCDLLEAEDCDGTPAPGASCESLGFAGGVLRCGSWCGFDVSGCDGCARGSHIERCLAVPVDSSIPMTLALAAQADSVALAWITSTDLDGAGRRAHFARLDSSLAVVAEAQCFALDVGWSIDISASVSGWLVAVDTVDGVAVLPLDLDGRLRGPIRVIAGAFRPVLGAQAGGGALLTYALDGRLDAELVADDGSARWAMPAHVFAEASLAELGDIVSTGDGFLVASWAGGGIRVARVELDGVVSSARAVAGVTADQGAGLAWNGAEARLTWSDRGTWLARLDRSGAVIGAPVLLDPAGGSPAPVVAFGDDSAVVVPERTGVDNFAAQLAVTVVDRDGHTTVPSFRVMQAPSGAFGYHAARSGAGLVVAWVGGGSGPLPFAVLAGPRYPGRISLARIAP